MKMQKIDVRSLWDGVTAAGGLAGRFLSNREREVRLGELASRSSLGGARESLRGRSVLLATRDQMTASLASIEADGIARRLVLCPADTPSAHVDAIIAQAEVDAVLCDAEDPENWEARVPLAVRSSKRLIPVEPPRADRATEWILLTSGSTGVPKLVVHSFASLSGPGRGSPTLSRRGIWSTFYDIRRYGGLAVFFGAMLGGGSFVLSSPDESTEDFLARVAARSVARITGTPSHWRRALMSPAARAFAPSYVRLSGEIADQAILDQLGSFWPDAGLSHAFASTEAGLAFEVNDARAGFPVDLIGRHGDVSLKIMDATIRVRSSRTAQRYLDSDRPLADVDGFVDTGDLVELRGDRYHFIGRRDGVVNVGGVKVHPEEVEAVINAHPGVRMALVKPRRNPITGAVVVADIVPRTGKPDGALGSAILEFCRDRLPRHKVPALVRFVEALPVTSNGKLRRRDE